ncbi:hypothetical protein pb186bvf_009743 [Paramecium bursaria]
MIQNIGTCPQHQNYQLKYICFQIDCELPQIRFCQECRDLGIHKHNNRENFLEYDTFCVKLVIQNQLLKEYLLQARQYKDLLSNQITELQEYQFYMNQLALTREKKVAPYVGLAYLLEYKERMDLPEVIARKGKDFILQPFQEDFDGLYRDIRRIIQGFHGRVIFEKGHQIRQNLFGFHASSVIEIQQRRYQLQNIPIQIVSPERIELSLNERFLMIICTKSIHFYNIAQNQIVQQIQIEKQCRICYFDEFYNAQYGVVIIGFNSGKLNIYYYQQNVITYVQSFLRIGLEPIYLFKPAIDSYIVKLFRLNNIFDLHPANLTEVPTFDIPQKVGLQHFSVDYQTRQSIFGIILNDVCFVFNYVNGNEIYQIKSSLRSSIKFSKETDQMALGDGLKGEILIYWINVIKNKKPQLKCKIEGMINFQYFQWAFDGHFIVIFLEKQCIIEYIGSIISTQITKIQHNEKQWQNFKFRSNLAQLFQLEGKKINIYQTNDQVVLPQ